MTPKSIVTLITIAVFGLVGLLSFSSFFESVDADQIVVIQSPTGDLTVFTDAGIKWQGFGKVTSYHKRSIYDINQKMRFNDGAHGTVIGSIQFNLPLNAEQMKNLYTQYPSQEAIQDQLIKTVVNKCVYMTGPLMSSKESYAEKRNALIAYVEDQVANGVFQTTQKDIRTQDEFTKEMRTRTVVEIVEKAGIVQRQEAAVLTSFGISTSNFSINSLDYDEEVEKQIASQQQATMDVQTAIANAKKAEQDALTVAKQGEANAARAKWEQEKEKARAVTLAEQEKEVAVTAAEKTLAVAKLDADAAEQYRIMKLRQADADATYKKRVIEADGALAQKLEALVQMNKDNAAALAKRAVPGVVFGGAGDSHTDAGANALLNMLALDAAKRLSVDMAVPKN